MVHTKDPSIETFSRNLKREWKDVRLNLIQSVNLLIKNIMDGNTNPARRIAKRIERARLHNIKKVLRLLFTQLSLSLL